LLILLRGIIIIITIIITIAYILTTAATHGATHHPYTTGFTHQGGATPHPNHWPATIGGHPIAAKQRSQSGSNQTSLIQWKDRGSEHIH